VPRANDTILNTERFANRVDLIEVLLKKVDRGSGNFLEVMDWMYLWHLLWEWFHG
jgi:hypothetical protein